MGSCGGVSTTNLSFYLPSINQSVHRPSRTWLSSGPFLFHCSRVHINRCPFLGSSFWTGPSTATSIACDYTNDMSMIVWNNEDGETSPVAAPSSNNVINSPNSSDYQRTVLGTSNSNWGELCWSPRDELSLVKSRPSRDGGWIRESQFPIKIMWISIDLWDCRMEHKKSPARGSHFLVLLYSLRPTSDRRLGEWDCDGEHG